MNLIGLMLPKIVSLLTIAIPQYGHEQKNMLLVLWLVKLVVDYDILRSGHTGYIYKFTKNMKLENEAVLVAVIRAVPSVLFLAIAVMVEAWFAVIPGIVSAIVYAGIVISEIKSAIDFKKRRS